MKTLAFGTINVVQGGEGDVTLVASSPSHGDFEMSLTPDELYLFLVDIGNQLSVARDIERKKREADDLLKEQRRV